jgi:Ni/Co efflux regulator RcnB
MRAHLVLCVALAALSIPAVPVFAAPPPHAAAHGVQRGDAYRFHRGERLPPAYRHHSYVVDNWRAHRLHAPPRGHHWVGIGADYLLVAIATGIIVDVLSSPRVVVVPAPSAGPSEPPAAGVFYYYCDSARAYYPYVLQCPEGWRVLPSTPPGFVRQ